MDEVSHYLLNHRQDLMTAAEWKAYRYFFLRAKIQASSSDKIRQFIEETSLPNVEDIDELVASGPEAFYKRVEERLLAEHGESILNRCPCCRALCRTPRAKQCPQCFHDWHHADRESR